MNAGGKDEGSDEGSDLSAADASDSRRASARPSQGATFVESAPGPSVPAGDLEPVAGDVIADKFKVIGRLGAGAMGIVLRAVDQELKREVALKLVRRHRSDEEFVRRRFLAEAKALASVRHRNVVQIYAHTRWEGRSVLVMEYMPCTSLASWLKQRGPQLTPLAFVAEALDAICAGTAAIHRAGSIHRDIKPDNILLGHHGRIAITDLGLARFEDDLEAPWVGGTPAYMSPTQLSAQDGAVEPTRDDDLWAIGVVAYELLTGQAPFGAGSAKAVGRRQSLGPPCPPSQLRAGLPPACDALFARIFAEAPADRPRRIEELRVAFSGLFRARGTSHHHRVVIVDDDPDFLRWLESVVGDLLPGAEISSFTDPREALDAATADACSLVITDLDMPEIDGHGLTQALRADTRSATVPILVLTGTGGADDWRALQRSGADAFLVKPVHLGVLTATLERLMRDAEDRGAPPSLGPR